MLGKALAGHATLNINVAGQDQERRARNDQNHRLSLSIVTAALIVGAGIASLSDMPGFAGLPWLSTLFLAVAAGMLLFLFIKRR